VALTPPDGEPQVADELARITPPPQVMSRAAATVISIAAGLLFTLLAGWIAARGSAVPAVDQYLHRWVISRRDPATITVARAVTWGGVTRIVLPALIVVGTAAARGGWQHLHRRLVSGILLACIAGAGVYAEIGINAAIGRHRPPFADWAGAAGGPSFPSVHTTAATLFAAACAWVIAARVRPGWPRRAVWAGAAGYAVAVGWSRVWLGVHWPTDVAGGWLFGAAWSGGCIVAVLTLRRRAAARRLPPSGQGVPASGQDEGPADRRIR
jgi:membrane-associated phospholipid phosphatase